MAISFLGVRTDRHGFGILTWKHVGTQKISSQNSKLVVSCCPYMPPRRTGMHKYFELPSCSTRENLFIHASLTTIGLIMTMLE